MRSVLVNIPLRELSVITLRVLERHAPVTAGEVNEFGLRSPSLPIYWEVPGWKVKMYSLTRGYAEANTCLFCADQMLSLVNLFGCAIVLS